MYSEAERYPAIRELLRIQVDGQFQDLATMLQLPRPDLGLHGGCNLTAGVLLCNIISGASVLFFESSPDAVRGRTRGRNHPESPNTLRSGERFEATVRRYFPAEAHPQLERDRLVSILYRYTRNPLAHSLGAGKARIVVEGGVGVVLEKERYGLPPETVVQVLRGDPLPPPGLEAAVRHEGGHVVIYIPGLAWGVCAMLRSLLADEHQVVRAEQTAQWLVPGIFDPGANGHVEGQVHGKSGLASSALRQTR